MITNDLSNESQSAIAEEYSESAVSANTVTVKSKILEKMKIIKAGGKKGKKLGDAIQKAAVKATVHGSSAWDEYMHLIVDGDPALLAKLRPLPANPKNPKIFKRNLALSYLIGNGNCGATSTGGDPETTGLIYGVGDELDKPLPGKKS